MAKKIIKKKEVNVTNTETDCKLTQIQSIDWGCSSFASILSYQRLVLYQSIGINPILHQTDGASTTASWIYLVLHYLSLANTQTSLNIFMLLSKPSYIAKDVHLSITWTGCCLKAVLCGRITVKPTVVSHIKSDILNQSTHWLGVSAGLFLWFFLP